MNKVRVYSKRNYIPKRIIHKLIRNLVRQINFSILSLEISFINSEQIQQLNKTHLEHDYSTDIITFNYSNVKNIIDAEIFISINDAIYNAARYKVELDSEIFRLIIHGILHLLDYNDQTTAETKIMKRLENKLLSSNKFLLLYSK